MEELIQTIAQALVDDPQQVRVSVNSSRHTSVLELQVAKDDTGKVIGKRGRTVTAMRTILSAVSAKQKKSVILEILE